MNCKNCNTCCPCSKSEFTKEQQKFINLCIKHDYLNERDKFSIKDDRLYYDSNLYLGDCKSLEYLPYNLTVGGILDLSDCTDIQSIPDNLTVGGDLWITDCPEITLIPSTCKVGGNIYIDQYNYEKSQS